jgi:hypothetical protein
MNFSSIRNLAFFIIIVLFITSLITLFTPSIIEGLETQTMQPQSRFANIKFNPVPPVTYTPTASSAPIELLQNFISNLKNMIEQIPHVFFPAFGLMNKIGENLDNLSRIDYTRNLPDHISKVLSPEAEQEIQKHILSQLDSQIELIKSSVRELVNGIETSSRNLNVDKLMSDFNRIKDLKINCTGVFG